MSKEAVFVSKIPIVGSLNLCLKMPGPLQKELAQSDNTGKIKHSKCGQILLVQANVKIYQYFGTFWTFSRSRVVGLSQFLLQ